MMVEVSFRDALQTVLLEVARINKDMNDQVRKGGSQSAAQFKAENWGNALNSVFDEATDLAVSHPSVKSFSIITGPSWPPYIGVSVEIDAGYWRESERKNG